MTDYDFEALSESRAPINVPGLRRSGGNIVLFGTGASLSARELSKLNRKTEYAAQKALVIEAEKTVEAVKADILIQKVWDTGATFGSVYVLTPPNQRVQGAVRNSSEAVQRRATSPSVQRGVIRSKKRALGSRYSGYEIKSNGRLGKIKDAQSSKTRVTWKDIPFTPSGTVARKNLYVGIGVGTVYAIYPHEGLGNHTGPRRFFTPHVQKWKDSFPAILRQVMEEQNG